MANELNWCLVSIAVGPSGRQEFELGSGENVVGRKREASINLAHLDVSREHCLIFVIDGTLALIDSGSRNGTFVNGQKVCARNSVTLFENDTVGFGTNTSTVEVYREKTPFLVYRVIKKISAKVFERLALEREKALCVKRKADCTDEVITVKKIRQCSEVSSSEEPEAGSKTFNTSSSRPVGLVEFFAVEPVEKSVIPSSSINNESNATRSSSVNILTKLASFFTKPTDDQSTLQNGSVVQNSAIEPSTPSLCNSTLSRTNEEANNVQNMSTAHSKKKLCTASSSGQQPMNSNLGLKQYPSPKVKKEFKCKGGEISDISSSDDDNLKPVEFPTFSLISDDEDDDLMALSQIFIKSEEPSQNLSEIPEGLDTSVIDDEILEIFDSDDDSFFEQHLSQNLSQSFSMTDETINEKRIGSRKDDDRLSKRKRNCKHKKTDGSVESKKSDVIQMEVPSSVENAKESTSKDVAVRIRAKTRHQHKMANDASNSLGVSKEKSFRELVSQESTIDGSLSRSTTKIKIPSGSRDTEVGKLQSGASKEESKSSKGLYNKGKSADKVASSTKTKEPPKVAILIEAKPLKEEVEKKDKVPAEVVSTVIKGKRQPRVTFKENIAEIKEFECLGNMKKLSLVPAHLLKEHPPKTPLLQWNSLLLRCCEQVWEICQWNIKWLQEFQRVESDPPLGNYHPRPIENRFSTFDDYCLTMSTLIMHEMWNELCRIHLLQTETQRFNVFSGVVEQIETNFGNKTLFVKCKVVTNTEGAPFLPNFGDLVGVQLSAPNKEKSHLYDSFGVVLRQYSKERVKPSRDINFLKKNLDLPNVPAEQSVVCPIDIMFRTSKSHSNVTKDCYIQIRVFKNIINQVKYFVALKKLASSPLKSIIIDPTKHVKNQYDNNRPEMQLHFNKKHHDFLNAQQREAVLEVSRTVTTQDSSVNLIHGPPGTGKSTAITCIILQLLHVLRKNHRKGPPLKILLCAPSNTAIDELVLKLLDIRKRMADGDRFKLTRVGNIKMMHPVVNEVSSTTLARRTLMMTPDSETLETEIALLQARKEGLRNGLNCSSKSNDRQKYLDAMEKVDTRLTYYCKTLANVKSGRAPCNPDENRKLLNQEECTIISGAEIIATTLCSSSSKKIADSLSDSTQFACCIIDEATQATEPEVLIPLHHDIKHLVLVGDPMQLGPTVTSKFAKEMKFEWSLYHRLMNVWKEYQGTNLYPLREQYRMHPDIVAFPSEMFYNSELKTPSFLQISFPFTSYRIISHTWMENANEESNDKEARFIVDLVQKVCGLEQFKDVSIGIIVPYQTQRNLILKILQDRNSKISEGVVVNTIDSFQGQEKDVVIFSCVRTKRIGFLSDRQRLNVALTRAKKCLLIVGNFQALKSDEVWSAMLKDAKRRDCIVDANPNDRIAPSIVFSKLFAKQINRAKPSSKRKPTT